MKAVFVILAAVLVVYIIFQIRAAAKFIKQRDEANELEANIKARSAATFIQAEAYFKSIELRKWCMDMAVRACTSGNAFVSFDTIKETYNDIYKIILQVEATDETSSR